VFVNYFSDAIGKSFARRAVYDGESLRVKREEDSAVLKIGDENALAVGFDRRTKAESIFVVEIVYLIFVAFGAVKVHFIYAARNLLKNVTLRIENGVNGFCLWKTQII
jgi:hypothetical protein